jgi:hypothetical protein
MNNSSNSANSGNSYANSGNSVNSANSANSASNSGNGSNVAMRRSTRRNSRRNEMVGGAKMATVGTKAQVYHGTAKHTSGGLKKKDLMKTKKGRIVSRKKHAAGKKALKRLVKAGYKAKKGSFKLFRK